MAVQVREIKTKKDIKKAVDFVYHLYKDEPNWVPPIRKSELEYFDPQKNPAINKFDGKFYLIFKDGKVAGRFGVAVSHPYNQKVGKKYVRIIRPEFIDDQEVFDAMIDTVRDYGRQRGMELMHGPLSFSNLDQQGLLVQGHEYLSPTLSVFHKKYYQKHFERAGFVKENDWIEFRIIISDEEVNKARTVVPKILERFNIKVVHFKSIKQAKEKYLDLFYKTLNDAFQKVPYAIPLDKELQEYYTRKYIDILNPRYLRVAFKNDEFVGFVLAIPSLSKALQKSKGRLFPFGIFHIMRALYGPNDTLEFIMAAVHPRFRIFGAGALIVADMLLDFVDQGGKYLETDGILEVNKESLNNWKQFKNKVQHKRRRIYVRKID